MEDNNQEFVNPEYMEKCIIKSALWDKSFGVLVSEKFLPEYFNTDEASIIFRYFKSHINNYKSIPQEEVILNSIEKNEEKEQIENYLKEINSINFDIESSYEWLYENTNNYLKDRAMKYAIMQSIDIVEQRGNSDEVKSIVEEALCKDLKIDLGLEYFGSLQDRLSRIFNATDIKIPSYFPIIDDLVSGGFPAYTLSVWAAVTHGGKSLLMANMLARQVLNGINGVLFTMEMSQDAFAQRFDSIYSMLDINKMYIQSSMKKKLLGKLKNVKSAENRGNLYIKEFPTGKAKVNDLRIYLRELALRDINVDVIYCDYINLMAPSKNRKNGNKYDDIVEIVRELRALSLEFNAPVISVSQINREGSFLDLKELNFNYVSECIEIANSSDFFAVLGHDPDKLNYASEVHYKVVKNRLGGRIGTIGKLYMDARSLKLYDEDEFDQWIKDARESGDERNPA